MRRTAALAIAVIGATLTGPGTAHAAPLGTVEVGFSTAYQTVGVGYVASAVCRALARGVEPEVVPVATEVTCTVGPATRSSAVPGAFATTAVATATDAPIVFCVSGKGVFLDTATQDIFTVTAGPSCVTFAG